MCRYIVIIYVLCIHIYIYTCNIVLYIYTYYVYTIPVPRSLPRPRGMVRNCDGIPACGTSMVEMTSSMSVCCHDVVCTNAFLLFGLYYIIVGLFQCRFRARDSYVAWVWSTTYLVHDVRRLVNFLP